MSGNNQAYQATTQNIKKLEKDFLTLHGLISKIHKINVDHKVHKEIQGYPAKEIDRVIAEINITSKRIGHTLKDEKHRESKIIDSLRKKVSHYEAFIGSELNITGADEIAKSCAITEGLEPEDVKKDLLKNAEGNNEIEMYSMSKLKNRIAIVDSPSQKLTKIALNASSNPSSLIFIKTTQEYVEKKEGLLSSKNVFINLETDIHDGAMSIINEVASSRKLAIGVNVVNLKDAGVSHMQKKILSKMRIPTLHSFDFASELLILEQLINSNKKSIDHAQQS